MICPAAQVTGRISVQTKALPLNVRLCPAVQPEGNAIQESTLVERPEIWRFWLVMFNLFSATRRIWLVMFNLFSATNLFWLLTVFSIFLFFKLKALAVMRVPATNSPIISSPPPPTPSEACVAAVLQTNNTTASKRVVSNLLGSNQIN